MSLVVSVLQGTERSQGSGFCAAIDTGCAHIFDAAVFAEHGSRRFDAGGLGIRSPPWSHGQRLSRPHDAPRDGGQSPVVVIYPALSRVTPATNLQEPRASKYVWTQREAVHRRLLWQSVLFELDPDGSMRLE